MEFTAIDLNLVREKIPVLDPATHKGKQGHAVIIGGSYGKIGAVNLSAKAALRSGCGLVSAYVPDCGYIPLQSSLPEAMVITAGNEKSLTKIELSFIPNAIGIGPGMGQEQATQMAMHQFLTNNSIPLVIDADALNILSQSKSWLELLPANSILTPHPKELERLIGIYNDDNQRINAVMSMAKKYKLIIVMKGATTLITDGKSIFKNTSGNAALATAGSGDVLSGLITGLAAQSIPMVDAAIAGVFLHGLTADIAISDMSPRAFIASDIIKYLGKAMKSMER